VPAPAPAPGPAAGSNTNLLSLSVKADAGGNTADGGLPTLRHDQTATATVTLDGPAPAGGAVVTISRSGEPVVNLPASITIAAGSSSGTFPITVSSVSHVTEVLVNAAFKNVTKTVMVRVSN
jgi:hypothetical protein